MIVGIEPPGLWQHYIKRKDNIGLPLMEVKRKYLTEQLQFDSFQSMQNSNSAAGGDSASIYPNSIRVELFNNGVSQGISTYSKTLDISLSPARRRLATIVEYASVPGVDCDYRAIFYEINEEQRPVISGWYARNYPCGGGKPDKLTGPTTTFPYGDYGTISGLGEGYRVTP